jgi:hypothetical protein
MRALLALGLAMLLGCAAPTPNPTAKGTGDLGVVIERATSASTERSLVSTMATVPVARSMTTPR